MHYLDNYMIVGQCLETEPTSSHRPSPQEKASVAQTRSVHPQRNLNSQSPPCEGGATNHSKKAGSTCSPIARLRTTHSTFTVTFRKCTVHAMTTVLQYLDKSRVVVQCLETEPTPSHFLSVQTKFLPCHPCTPQRRKLAIGATTAAVKRCFMFKRAVQIHIQ